MEVPTEAIGFHGTSKEAVPHLLARDIRPSASTSSGSAPASTCGRTRPGGPAVGDGALRRGCCRGRPPRRARRMSRPAESALAGRAARRRLAGSCGACAGRTSTWRPDGCRCAKHWCRLRTRWRSATRRRVRAAARSTSTTGRFRRCATRSRPAPRNPTAWSRRTTTWCSSSPTAHECTRTSSARSSTGGSPGCRCRRSPLHDPRHTHATRCSRPVPVRVVSERLGHANVAFTMNVYQHVLPGMRAEAPRPSWR